MAAQKVDLSSNRGLWDDILSGYPATDWQEWAYSPATVYHAGAFNCCWIRDRPGGPYCSQPVKNFALGLCENHIDELKEDQ